MKITTRFSLARHEGPYETWPLYTDLLIDGQPVDAKISGYDLRAQYETGDGYILVTEYDCPFEEAVTVTFLDKSFRALGKNTIGAPYATFWFDRIEWIDDRHFFLFIQNIPRPWKYTINPSPIPFLRPCLIRWFNRTYRPRQA